MQDRLASSKIDCQAEREVLLNVIRMQNDFKIQKPLNDFLSTLVDYYFFIDIPIAALHETQEYVIPFPRITFGYFFDHPFMVTNHSLEVSEKAEMVISRISNHKISVLPLTDRIKILGAHVKPHALAHLTEEPIHQLPWLIHTKSLFGRQAASFRKNISYCLDHSEMFDQVEKIFLDSLRTRNLGTITQAVQLIESATGDIRLAELAEELNLSSRALRDQFHKYIGCAPKEFIQLVQLKQSVQQINFTDDSLTQVTYSNHYFDQPHFINSFKKITGRSPKNLKKEMANFRFLQF